MATDTEEYATAVTSETATYLSEVRECTVLLESAIEAYGTDAFPGVRDRVSERESAADSRLRDLRTLLGSVAPPNYTDVYLRTGSVMRLYALVDEIPDGAERFVHDLAAFDPALSPAVSEEFASMAALTVEVVDRLADLVEAFVTDLVSQGDPARFTGDIEYVAGLESDCDAHRQAAIERAFADLPTADALVVRDLAQSLDGVADAAEAAADHLLFMQGDQR